MEFPETVHEEIMYFDTESEKEILDNDIDYQNWNAHNFVLDFIDLYQM